MSMKQSQHALVKQLICQALDEDGASCDITSLAIFGKKSRLTHGFLVAKQNLVLSGIDVARDVFYHVSKKIRFVSGYSNGAQVKKGERLARVEGPIADLLRAERVALNFLQHLSGVATLTHQFVEKIKPYSAAILDTRKTTPGLRYLEKRAVVNGGGHNHRFNLSDQYLIKDNHIAACGGVSQAIRCVQSNSPRSPLILRGGGKGKRLYLIEVEVCNLSQLKEALLENPDIILLDNMTLLQIRQAVKLTRGQCPLEVSGGVNLKNVRKIAQTGVSRISIGALTHSAPAVDMSFEVTL